MRRHLLLLLLLLPSLAAAQPSSQGVLCANQGTVLNFAAEVNCGAGMTCSWSNGICTLTGAGGGGTVTGSGTPPQVAVWDGATSLTGYPGLVFTAPTLTVSGADNGIDINGSTTGNPVIIGANGSDTDVSIQVIPKGNFGGVLIGSSLPPGGVIDGSGLTVTKTNASPAVNLYGLFAPVFVTNRSLGTFNVPLPLQPFDTSGGMDFNTWSDVQSAFFTGVGWRGLVTALPVAVTGEVPTILQVITTNPDGTQGQFFFASGAGNRDAFIIGPGGPFVPTSYALVAGADATANPLLLKRGDDSAFADLSLGALTVNTRTGTPATFATFDSGGTLVAGAAYSAPTGGTVTSIATTSPITGGTITGSGTIGCPTCVTNNLPTVGGIIGGPGVSTGATAPFASGISNIQFPPGPGTLRGLYLNTATTQTSGLTNYAFQFAQAIGGTVSIRPEIGTSIRPGDAAGVYSSPVVQAITTPFTTIALNVAGNGAITPTAWSSEFLMTDGGLWIGSYNESSVPATTTYYQGPFSPLFHSSEAFTTWAIPVAGTLKNFCFRLNTTVSATGSIVVTIKVNGSASALTYTAPAGDTTTLFCDRTHTVAVSAGDSLVLSMLNNGSVTSVLLTTWSLELLPNSTVGLVGGTNQGAGAIASGSTTYWRPFGSTSNATEANVRMAMPRAGTTTNFCVMRATASSVGTTTATLFKNGSGSGQLSMTIGNATGVQCTTGSVAWAAGDTMTMEVKNTVACTGGCPALAGWSVDY